MTFWRRNLAVAAVAALTMAVGAMAQGSNPPAQAGQPQQQANPPVATSIPPTTNETASTYGGLWEAFLSGYAEFPKATSVPQGVGGQSVSISTTDVGGGEFGLRYHLNDWTAFETRIAVTPQTTQIYQPNESVTFSKYDYEGGYLFTIPTGGGIRPYLMAGMDFIDYKPGSNGNNTPGASSQWRKALTYGGGFHIALNAKWGLLVDYRGLFYHVPDFNLIGIDKWNHLPQPSFGLVYHF